MVNPEKKLSPIARKIYEGYIKGLETPISYSFEANQRHGKMYAKKKEKEMYKENYKNSKHLREGSIKGNKKKPKGIPKSNIIPPPPKPNKDE